MTTQNPNEQQPLFEEGDPTILITGDEAEVVLDAARQRGRDIAGQFMADPDSFGHNWPSIVIKREGQAAVETKKTDTSTSVEGEVQDDTPRDENGRAILGGRRDRAMQAFENGQTLSHDEVALKEDIRRQSDIDSLRHGR